MALKKPSTEGEMGSGDSDDEFFNVKLPNTPVLPEIKKQPVKKVYSPSRTKVTYDYKFDSSSDSEQEDPKQREKSPQKDPDPNVFTPVPKKSESLVENMKISQSTSKVVQKINDELKSMKNKKPEIEQQVNVSANIPTVSSQALGIPPAAVIVPQTIVGPTNQPVMPIGQGMMVPTQMGMMPGNMMNMAGNMMSGPGPMGGMMGVAPNPMQGMAMGMQNNLMPMQMMGNMMGMMGAQPNMMMGNMMNPNMMGPMIGMASNNMMGNPNMMLPGNMMGNPNPMMSSAGNMMGNPNPMMSNPVAGPMGSTSSMVNNPGGLNPASNPNPNTPSRVFNPSNPVGNQIRVRNPAPGTRPPVSFRPRANNFKWQNNKIPPRGFSPNNIRLPSTASFDKKELRYIPLESEQSERRDSDTGSTRSSSPGSDIQSPVELPNNFKNDGSFMEMFKKMKDVGEEREDKSKSTGESSVASAGKKPGAFIPSIVGKRRGGRVLKTGLVKKVKKVTDADEDKGPKDAWSMYMAEVKKYREASCEEEGKTRPLVK